MAGQLRSVLWKSSWRRELLELNLLERAAANSRVEGRDEGILLACAKPEEY